MVELSGNDGQRDVLVTGRIALSVYLSVLLVPLFCLSSPGS